MPTAPVIRIDEPGSFAWGVFHERHPELVRRVLDALPYGPGERAAIERLLVESTSGVLEPLGAAAHDHAQWLEWGQGLWGAAWGRAPFLWAEGYFYRRLLEATGYFRPGVWQGIDPFAPFKSAELASAAVDEELAALGGLGGLKKTEREAALLSSALWGNRADLSFQLTAEAAADASSGLIADDSSTLWAELERARGGRVCLVADNAGRELLPDLVLLDHLLTSGLAAQAVLWVKPQPYFVSDATMTDLISTVERLRTAPEQAAAVIGRRLRSALGTGRLAVRTHPFFCAPLPFRQLPADLRAQFDGVTMTILKGDLNYRRVVGDRLWPPTTPFAEVVDHFPSPVAALRTLKSDVIVGLTPAEVAELDATGEPWRTSGRYAVVQVHLQR
ncbi:damage-control phosphatase ARMT1 family protein [Kitasatospora azatica]|uniref:damage-control phosphatase ARMT1 family protein n=1 Tax=Kitasatospora azatica TaxID=58347 RepID=UPI00056CF823|nr:damage-control phosphatase ARMT1 family protein [Kitasatospora azatica]